MKTQETKDEGQGKGSGIQEIQDSSVRRWPPRILESLNPIRLLHDTGGQVLLLGIIVVIALLVFTLAIPNGTQAVTQKMRAQTAADAGAFTGSIWLARTFNLSANMNIGIKSVYTWMTVLTVGSALAQALYSDSLDPSVEAMGAAMSSALFGNSNPVTASHDQYPISIQRLGETGQWLSDLQDDIAVVFPALAQTLGSEQARRNASGGNASSQNPGGMVLVRTNDTTPLLVTDHSGDSLMYSDLLQLGASLEHIPTNDSNIGPANGVVLVDSHNFEIKAYYGDSSRWITLKQGLIGKLIVHQWYDTFPNEPDSLHKIYSRHHFYRIVNDPQLESAVGKSWIGQGVGIWYIDSLKKRQPKWRVYGKHSYSIPHPGDTVWVHQSHWQRNTEPGWGPLPPGDTADGAYPYIDSGYDIVKSGAFYTGFYHGADSTNGHQGPKVLPRRVNPDRKFHAVAYVWRLGAGTSPRGLSPAVGGSLFPRTRVAAAYPLLTVARSEPYLAASAPTAYEYYFTPAWDVRLTPLDSAGVQDICNDEAYDTLGLSTLDLEGLRRYVLLP
ncbi:MAG: Tad domain-containing protein [candidate division WOR-3 bacterium]|nr:Tad domain-containing protein [candidate division WOR-3 bacterium]